jgi:hypothetical protein
MDIIEIQEIGKLLPRIQYREQENIRRKQKYSMLE